MMREAAVVWLALAANSVADSFAPVIRTAGQQRHVLRSGSARVSAGMRGGSTPHSNTDHGSSKHTPAVPVLNMYPEHTISGSGPEYTQDLLNREHVDPPAVTVTAVASSVTTQSKPAARRRPKWLTECLAEGLGSALITGVDTAVVASAVPCGEQSGVWQVEWFLAG